MDKRPIEHALESVLQDIETIAVETVKQWANLQTTPGPNDVLQALWTEGNPFSPWPEAAQDLASRTNSAFGADLQGSDINPPGSIKTVGDLVKAVTQ
jgi:hypothetical protein